MNIYVANLNYQVSDDDLRELFTPYGTVTSAKIINDHTTGRSRGFGFVEMADKNEALKAIDELNETTIDGKVISVNEARPKSDKPRSNYGDNNRGGGGGGNRGGGGYGSDRRSKSW